MCSMSSARPIASQVSRLSPGHQHRLHLRVEQVLHRGARARTGARPADRSRPPACPPSATSSTSRPCASISAIFCSATATEIFSLSMSARLPDAERFARRSHRGHPEARLDVGAPHRVGADAAGRGRTPMAMATGCTLGDLGAGGERQQASPRSPCRLARDRRAPAHRGAACRARRTPRPRPRPRGPNRWRSGRRCRGAAPERRRARRGWPPPSPRRRSTPPQRPPLPPAPTRAADSPLASAARPASKNDTAPPRSAMCRARRERRAPTRRRDGARRATAEPTRDRARSTWRATAASRSPRAPRPRPHPLRDDAPTPRFRAKAGHSPPLRPRWHPPAIECPASTTSSSPGLISSPEVTSSRRGVTRPSLGRQSPPRCEHARP